MTGPHLVAFISFHDAEQVAVAASRVRSLPEPPDVLVVDNGNGRHGAELEVIRSSGNIGYCAAANDAVAVGFDRGYAAVTIANSDVEISAEGWLALHRSIAAAGPDVAVIGGIEVDEHDRVRTAGGMGWSPRTGKDQWGRSAPRRRTSALFAQGGFVTLLPPVRAVSGPFDERLFMYFDEIDLGLRLRDAGLSVVIDPAVVYRHDNENGRYRPFRGYLMHRNRALVVRRVASSMAPIAHAVGLGAIVAGAVARLPHPRPRYTYASLRGWLDGCRGTARASTSFGLPDLDQVVAMRAAQRADRGTAVAFAASNGHRT